MGSKKLRKLLLFLPLLVLLGCGKKENEAFNEEEFIQSLIPPTVMITVGFGHASGVIIENTDDRIVIATVAHLCEGFDQGIISFSDGHAGFGDVFFLDTKDDVCLMSIRKEDMDESFANSIVAAKSDISHYDELSVDDEIYVVGSAVNGVINVSKGTFKARDYYVPEFDQYMIYMYCDVFEGFSGSGCYDQNGYLIGLLAGGSDTSEAVCIPITDVYKDLNGGM